MFMDNLRIYTKGGTGGSGKPRVGGVGGRGGHVYVICKEDVTLKDVLNSNESKRFLASHGQASGYVLITARKRSCGKVMFSQVFACSRKGKG